MTKAQSSLKVRWRRALLFLSMLVLAAAALHYLAIFVGSGSSVSVFAQAPPAIPFNIVTFGDSIVWGQGLPESMKFRTLVANWLQSRLGSSRKVFQWKTHAHSGATILGDTYKQLDGEIPDDDPSISLQVDLTMRDLLTLTSGKEDSRDVDLVLVDGGANNVNVLEILKPNHSSSTIERFTHAAMDKMEDLLQKVKKSFPNAAIVVIGYYPPVSPSSDLTALAALLGKFGAELGVLGAVGGVALAAASKDQMVKNSAAFADTGYKRLADMVNRLNPPPPAPARVVLAWPNFQSDNAYGAPNSFLWKVEDFVGPEAQGLLFSNPPPPGTPDRVAWERAGSCQFKGRGLTCIDASMGHPNVAGAQAYANAIIDQLQGPLAARIFAPPPPPVVSSVNPDTTPCGSTSRTVAMTGANFYFVSRVMLDGRQSLAFTVQAKSLMLATIPNSIPAGTHAITVDTPFGSASGAFNVTPIITSINPAHGPMTGGTNVTVSGACLEGVFASPVTTTGISFGAKFASAICVGTRCDLVTPPAASLGEVDVTANVRGARSAITSVDRFSYDKEDPSPSDFQLPNARFGPQTAVVVLDGYAPPGGAMIDLSSSDSSHVSVQKPVKVSVGATYTNVGLTFLPTLTSEDVTLTATFKGNSAKAIAHLLPWPPLTLSADFVSDFVYGQMFPGRPAPTSITGVIFLNKLAPTGGAVVSMTYTPPPLPPSHGRISPPASRPPVSATVTIPAGSFWTTFTFPYPRPVGPPDSIYPVTISAAYSGASASKSLELSPSGPARAPTGPPGPGPQKIQ